MPLGMSGGVAWFAAGVWRGVAWWWGIELWIGLGGGCRICGMNRSMVGGDLIWVSELRLVGW